MGLERWTAGWRNRLAVDVRPLQAALQQPSPYPLFLRTPLRRRLLAVYCVALGACLGMDLYRTYRLIAGKA